MNIQSESRQQMPQPWVRVFLHFPLVQTMWNCNLFFWSLWVGQAQSGFNHKIPWTRARAEWGKLLVYLWCPYKHKYRRTVRQLRFQRLQLQVGAGSRRNGWIEQRTWTFAIEKNVLLNVLRSFSAQHCPFFSLSMPCSSQLVTQSRFNVRMASITDLLLSNPTVDAHKIYTHLYFHACEDPH